MAREIRVNVIGDAKSAQGVFANLEGSMGKFQSALGPLGQALGPLGDSLGVMAGGFDRVHQSGSKIGGTILGIGAAASGLGAIGLKLAEPLEKAEATLKTVVANTGNSFDAFKRQFDDTAAHMEKFGHKTSDTDEALAKLTAATNDPKKAIADMGVVSEYASFKHISLAEAAGTVAKVIGGSTKPLKEFGINVKDLGEAAKEADAAQKDLTKALGDQQTAQDTLEKATKRLADLQEVDAGKKKLTIADEQHLRDARVAVAEATANVSAATDYAARAQDKATKTADTANATHMDTAKVLDLVHQKLKGVDQAQADTFGGKMQAWKTHIEDVAASLGAKLGKELTVAGPALMGVGAVIETGVIPKLAAMSAGLLRTGVSAVMAMGSWVASMIGIETSSVAASVVVNAALGIGVIAAIALIGVAIYELFKHWDTIWGGIKAVASAAWSWIKQHADMIAVAFGPIGIAVDLLAKNWDTIWGAIKTTVSTAWHVISSVIDAIASAIGKVIGTIEHLIDKVNHIPGAGIIKSALGFADGGIVPGPHGMPVPIIAHGGERIMSTSGGIPMAPAAGFGEIHTHIYMNDHEIIHAINRDTRSKR